MRDRRMDGQTDGVKPVYPPTTSLCGGYNYLKCHSNIPGTMELISWFIFKHNLGQLNHGSLHHYITSHKTYTVWCVCFGMVTEKFLVHYSDVVIKSPMPSQITSLTIVYSTIYSGTDQRKHKSSASLAFVRGIHWWPVNSPQKGPVTWKMFPFDDVIMGFMWSIYP